MRYANSLAAALWHQPAEGITGRRHAELFPAEEARRQADILARVLQTGQDVCSEEFIPYPKGHRWHEVRLTPLRDAHQGIVGVMGSVRDVTDRKRYESQRQTQRDLAIALGSTSDLETALSRLVETALRTVEVFECGGIHLLDSAGDLKLVVHRGLSAAFADRIVHFPAGCLETMLVREGKPVYGVAERIPGMVDPCREAEGLKVVAMVPLVHEGKGFGCLNLASRVHSQIPASARVSIEAIAAQAAGAIARIRAETALRESEARLRAIVTSAPVLLFAVDGKGLITFEAGQALTALGQEAGAHVGRSIHEVYGSVPGVAASVQRALLGEKFNALVEIEGVTLDSWFSPVRDRDGRVAGAIAVGTNVTERHRLERQILEISDRERARLGQDLHDGLCQQLVSLGFDATALESELSAQNRPEAGRVRRLQTYLDEAITAARRLSRGLFPVSLASDGLSAALEELARATQERFGIKCRFEGPDTVCMPDEAVGIHLYRIAQEAVNNAVKHARASSIFIRLDWAPDQLDLLVEDDGVGLRSGGGVEGAGTGMGLHIMDYRARTIGATLQVGLGRQRGDCSLLLLAGPAPINISLVIRFPVRQGVQFRSRGRGAEILLTDYCRIYGF